jgi:hypothetical protein
MPVAAGADAGKARAHSDDRFLYIPPQTAPGLGPPCAWNGAWVQR